MMRTDEGILTAQRQQARERKVSSGSQDSDKTIGKRTRQKKKKPCFKDSPNSISSTLRVINAAMRCWTGRSKVDSSRVDIAKLGGPRTHVLSV